MAIPNYKLSTVLHGHSLDVRCVAVTQDDCILSSSRDRTAKLWHPEGIKDFANVVTYKGHSNFVSSVCFVPPCEAHPYGLVATASNDTTICAYNVQDPVPVIIFKGHENVVCCVTPGLTPGTILSASWDSTARLWSVSNIESAVVTFRGHEAAVWSAIEISNNNIVTGSADKNVVIWNREGGKVKVLKGHTDCVRALTVASSESFLSCGNDASVRLWTNQGECLNTFYGHSNYIYSVCMNPKVDPMCFVTCGEDSTVRVWLGGDNVRTIAMPAQSVWSTAVLTNGDIITGSSDGLVRVFSTEPARHADTNTQNLFDEEVEKLQLASMQEIGGVKITDLPGPEILFEPGKTDGQTKLVRSGTNVKCYSWSMASQSWTEVGDVLGSAGATEGKTSHEGKEYDFVFSVDIEDGKPPIKLPYNKGEDPWVAAQAFIHKNNLPQVYLEQVANFIVTNSGQNPIAPSNGSYMDPFTGGSRYVPGASAPAGRAGVNADPFTGSSSYSSEAPNPIADSSKPTYFPQKTYLRFDQGNFSLILDKLKAFNAKLADASTQMSEEDLENIVELSNQPAVYNTEIGNKLKQLLEWPSEMLFPILDVVRLAVRNAEISADLFDKSAFGPVLIRMLLNNLLPGGLPANQLLSLRVLTNAFIHLPGEMMVLQEHEPILNALICLTDMNKNVQIAAATLLLNLSVALGQQSDVSLLCECVLQVLTRLADHEAYFRGLVALGTLVTESTNKLVLVSKVVSSSSFMRKLRADSVSGSQADPIHSKVITCSQQILHIL